jgi:hypothetical protein
MERRVTGLVRRLGNSLRRTAPLRAWAALSGAYLVAYVTIFTTRSLYAGDSRYYAALTLWLSGSSQDQAYRTVRTYTAGYGFSTPPESVLFNYGLTAPRLLYPLLSAPFVKLMGLKGLDVVPALSLAGFAAVTFIAVAGRWGWRAALVPLLLVSVDWRLIFYSASAITEGLTTCLSALILLVAVRRDRLGPTRTTVLLILFTTLMAFARQATLIPAGAFALAWLALTVRRRSPRNRWAAPALVTMATAVLVQVAQGLIWPGFSQITHLEGVTGTHSLAAALRRVPRLFLHIAHVDTLNLSRADAPLVLLLAAAALSCVVLWNKEETYLLIGALAAAAVYNVSNGTPAAFRYEMPTLPFLVLSVAALAAWVGVGRGAASARGTAELPTGQDTPVSAGTPMPA